MSTTQTETANEPEIPVEVSTAAPVIVAKDNPAPEPEGGAEPEASGAEAAADGDSKKPQKLPEWAQKEMATKAFEAREATRRAKALEEELAKLKGGDQAATATTTPTDVQKAQDRAPEGGYRSQADFDAAVQAETARRQAVERMQREQQTFVTKLDTIWSDGVEKFKADFDTVAANLQAVGFTPWQDPNTGSVHNTELMQLVMETDNPAQVLFDLGSDPNRAKEIMALPPSRRAIEIAKLSVATPQKATPAPISNAPRPVQPVEGSARPNGEPNDSDDDDTWFAKRNEQIRRRYSAA